jgi:chromatin assembly factor 1 subunit B
MRAKTIQILWHDKQPIFSMDFNGKENILATCGGSIVRIWSVGESVEYLQTLDRHQSTVNTVRFHDELLASGGDDGTIIIWERTDEFKVKGVLRGPSDCYDLCWSPDGKKIASAGIDATIRIYDTTENKCLFVLSQHQHFVQGVAWDPLNRFLASQSSDRALHLYQIDSQKPKLLQKFVKLESKLYQDEDLNSFFRRLSFSPDGSLLVTVAGISPDQESFCAYVYDRNAFGGY